MGNGGPSLFIRQQVPIATPDNDGLMSAAQAAMLAGPTVGPSIVPPTYIVSYVRSNGNDSTGDGSLENPYLTPERARQDAPQNSNGYTFRVDMTDYGTYMPPTAFPFPTMNGSLTSFSMGAGLEVDDFGSYIAADFELYASPTVLLSVDAGAFTISQDSTGASLALVTVTGASWTANQFANCNFAMPGLYQTLKVISNTSDTLYVTQSTVYIPGSYWITNSFTVTQPSCTIDLTATGGLWFENGELNLGEGSGGAGFNGNFTLAGFAFTNVSTAVDNGLCAKQVNVFGCSGYSVVPNGVCDVYQAWGCELLGTSHDEDGAGGFATLAQNTGAYNCLINYCSPVSTENGGLLNIFGCYKVGGDGIGEGSYHGFGDGFQVRQTFVFFTIANNTSRGGVRSVGNRNLVVMGFCDFTNCGYGGITLAQGARGYITGPISGTGNGANIGPSGYGVYILNDSQLFIAAITEFNVALNASNITLSGLSGNIAITGLPSITWTQFFAWQLYSNVLGTGGCVFQNDGPIKKASIFNPTSYLTANYAAKDYDFVLANPTAAGFSITFPAAALSNALIIRNTTSSTNALTLVPTGGDTIDITTLSGAGAYATFYSDSVSKWYRTG